MPTIAALAPRVQAQCSLGMPQAAIQAEGFE
jgi:hypothetical protein